MTSWDGDGPPRWFKSEPKKPPPAHGIKIDKAGTTWWGEKWISALEGVLLGGASRLARGRTYARAGRTHDLVVTGGRVRALVTGSRATPYEVTMTLAQHPSDVWDRVIEAMTGQARFAAELLQGRMPENVDDVFRTVGVSLFPATRADLDTDCSCPDWGDPCKHVAATHYVLGEALDRDPFLLFELRGRTKEQVLSALRAARSGRGKAATKRRRRAAELDIAREIPTVKLGRIAERDYDAPRGALPAMQFSFEAPETHGATLRQLGAPAAWRGEASPADALAPLVRAAAERARRIAMSEPETPLPSAKPKSQPSPTAKPKRPRRRH